MSRRDVNRSKRPWPRTRLRSARPTPMSCSGASASATRRVLGRSARTAVSARPASNTAEQGSPTAPPGAACPSRQRLHAPRALRGRASGRRVPFAGVRPPRPRRQNAALRSVRRGLALDGRTQVRSPSRRHARATPIAALRRSIGGGTSPNAPVRCVLAENRASDEHGEWRQATLTRLGSSRQMPGARWTRPSRTRPGL